MYTFNSYNFFFYAKVYYFLAELKRERERETYTHTH